MSHQESKWTESLRREENGRVFSGRHMNNIQKETHVVSVMTNLHKETCAVVRGKMDDRLLLHLTRRPRLTKGRQMLKNRPRRQLLDKKKQNSVPLQKL